MAPCVYDHGTLVAAGEGKASELRTRLDAARAAAKVGTWVIDVAARTVDADEPMFEMYGLTADGQEVSLETFTACVHPEDRRDVEAVLGRAMSRDGEDCFQHEHRVLHPHGAVRHLQVQGRARRDEQGAVTLVTGCSMDLTAHRDASHAEARAARLLATVVDAVRELDDPDAIRATAQALLGDSLRASRVAFADVDHDSLDLTIARDWTDGLPSVAGTYSLKGFGADSLARYLAGVPFVSRDTAVDLLPGAGLEAARAIGAMATIAAPVLLEGRLVALAIVHQATARDWTEREVTTVTHLARAVAVEVRRARAVAAVHRSELQLRELADAMPQMVWAARADGTVDYYNRRWYEYTGLAEGEIGTPSWAPVIFPGDIERIVAVWTESLRAGQPHQTECRYRRASDGTYRWHLSRALPVRDGTGTIVRWFGTNTDIHDQKVAFDVYRAGQEQLALAIAAGQLGTWQLDLRARTVTGSEGGKAHLGRSRSETLTLEDLRAVIHPESQETAASAFAEAAASGLFACELRVTWPDGEPHWVHVRGWMTRGADGQPEALVGVSQDATDRKLAQEKREALLVAERAARAESEQAGRLKDEFLATLSHELRTPLNAIVGWTTILRTAAQKSPSPEGLRGLEIIERNARAQAQIIDDALDMSRIVSGNLRLDIQAVDLAAIVRAGVDTIQAAADAKSIQLQVILDPSTRGLSGDPGRLHQVFWNLLSNAVKFTPKGGRIQVVLERVNSHVEVRVTDTGEGISPDFLPFVFDRFRQADGSITRRHGGLGLGLSIAKQLVDLHGGSVEVQSPGIGRGTTLIVRLPQTALHAEPTPTHPAREQPTSAIPALALTADMPLRGVRVLVVDDEPDGRELVGQLLQTEGAVVRTASSVAQALALFAESPPDVLVSDIGMPDEDGYSLMRRVRALPPGRGGAVPATALTAYARSVDRVRVLEAGFQMHLAKPVDPTELIATVMALSRVSMR